MSYFLSVTHKLSIVKCFASQHRSQIGFKFMASMSDQLSSIKVLNFVNSDNVFVYKVVPALVPVISNVRLLLGMYRDRTSRSRLVSVSFSLGLGLSRSRSVSVSVCLGLGQSRLGRLDLGRLGLT
jgi:hypothetical protein